MLPLLLLSSLLLLDAALSTPVPSGGVTEGSDTSAMLYLARHGYIPEDEEGGTAQLLSNRGLAKAIMHFQVKSEANLYIQVSSR